MKGVGGKGIYLRYAVLCDLPEEYLAMSREVRLGNAHRSLQLCLGKYWASPNS